MKKTTQLLTALICLALGGASVHAGLSYWDSNSSASGAGTTPTGTWDTDTFWSTDSGGAAATAAWTTGDTAVFSAGTDAINPFTVTLGGDVQPAGITIEEGVPTITGGSITMNAADFPIIANTNATINSILEGTGFKKTGTGTLTLGGATSFHGSTDTIAEGVVAITSKAALGDATVPTIVSNGATLEVSIGLVTEPTTLNGSGFNNLGALRSINGPGNNAWNGKTLLGSDATINFDSGGTWGWGGGNIDGTNGGNNFNLTLGGTSNGTIRLNIGGRAIILNNGVVYKEGTCAVTFETPIIVSALYFNGGNINSRVAGGFFTGPIYVGAGAGQFRTGSGGPSFTLPNIIELSAGANPVFNPLAANSITCGKEIRGLGSLSMTNQNSAAYAGTLFLNAANTYSGNTTIQGGILTLGPNGSISNSPVIDVQSAKSTFNVTNDFVLQASQTLKCNGTCNFSNNLTLLGQLSNLGVDKSAATPKITVLGPVLTNAWTGTVTVANVGWLALAAGDSFQIFNKPLSNGLALTVAGTAGVVWNNNLAVDGSISVASAPAPVPSTNLTVQAVGPTSFSLSGLGVANSVYAIFTSTNVATPLADWWLIGTTAASGGGVISFTDSQATNDQRFYRFGQ